MRWSELAVELLNSFDLFRAIGANTVSPVYLEVFGIGPAMERTFSASEDSATLGGLSARLSQTSASGGQNEI
jgi:hypothetical protein